MITEARIEEIVTRLFDNIEFPAQPGGLYEPLRYMIRIGGKRIRPRLCLTAYFLYSNELSDEILEPAAALEVFHTFTLIHDDIMDNAPVRRGVPTVCRKWDDNTAILSGDVMCIDSYRRIAKAPKKCVSKVLDLFNATAAQVCEGQQYDMDFESRENVGMNEYIRMIGLKTAVLIACAAKMGAVIAGAPDRTCDLLYDFGYNLGLAFQIADDYLDTFGDVKTFGKAIGGDIINGKKTWLVIRAAQKARALEEAGILEEGRGASALYGVLARECPDDASKAAKIRDARNMFTALGIDEDAKYEILKYHTKALECAQQIGLSKFRYELLHRYADRLVGRDR